MIVVAGEALMDVYDAGPTDTGQALDARIGGSPYNVAMGLARLAQPVAFCGALSRGFLGERLMRSMLAEGIDTRCVQRVDAPCSVCLVGLDDAGVPRYDFVGEQGADRQLHVRAVDALPAGMTALHVGSYAMVVPPVADVQARLVDAARARGAVVAYDPNVRTVVEPDLERWRAVLEHMVCRAHLLKISEEDMATLYPGRSSDDLMASWLGHGVQLVVMTRGADGAVARTARVAARVPAQPTAVVDTVGAGDTFQAALLAALAETATLSPAGLAGLSADQLKAGLNWAATAAAITCSRRGADLPRRAELPAFAVAAGAA